VDYEETFAPVVKMITMRTIIVIVTSQGWPIHQMNIKNAFLYSDLKKIFIWNLYLVCSSPYISCV
jgi:hypothetical protein